MEDGICPAQLPALTSPRGCMSATVGPIEEAAAMEKPRTVEVGNAFHFDCNEADDWRRGTHDFIEEVSGSATGACVTSLLSSF